MTRASACRVTSWTLLAALAATAPACSRTRYAQTAREPPAARDGGAGASRDAGADAGASRCAGTLAQRITVSRVGVNAGIRYKRWGYDGFAGDERIALAIAPDGSAQVAWLDNAGGAVHVTPLDASLARAGSDVQVDGVDVGGLVAQPDGFALLTRRDDPGEPLSDPAAAPGVVGKAAVLVRYRGGREAFAAALTGTTSITQAADPDARDCSTELLGRLAWNGHKYGAYFAVHGCAGDPHASYYADKLVYADDSGAYLPGGWGWNCSINEGIRLLPEADVFTSLCISDGQPFAGLDLVIEGMPALQLAPEMTTAGYCAGRFGSVVKLSDGGYLVGWLSRGVSTGGSGGGRPRAAKMATDIALIRLGADYHPLGDRIWLLETPDVAETSLHLARYGSDRIFVSWESIEDLQCSPTTCFGRYTGTHARLIDADGNFLTPDATIPAVPNGPDDIAVLPDGDLAWAFVADPARDYSAPLALDAKNVPAVAAKRELSLARVAYCDP